MGIESTNTLITIATILVALVGIYVAVEGHIYTRLKDEPNYRLQLAELLRSVSIKGISYTNSVSNFLVKIKDVFGTPFSVKSLGMAMVVSLFYSTLVFVFVYSIGGPHAVGNTPVFPEQFNQLQRIGFLFVFLIFSISIIN